MRPVSIYQAVKGVQDLIGKWDDGHIDDQPVYESGYPYRFGVFSDIHLCTSSSPLQGEHDSYLNGYDDFVQALRKSRQNGIKFLCVTGDLGMSGMPGETSETSNRVVELNFWKGAISDSDLEDRFLVLTIRGNHDGPLTAEQWTEKTGRPEYYSIRYKREIFVFISNRETPTTVYGDNSEPYTPESIEFLKKTLEDNPGRRIFVFMHYPLNSFSSSYQLPGMADFNASTSAVDYSRRNHGLFTSGYSTTYSDGTWTNEQCQQVKDILASYTSGHVFLFTGHNHFRFQVDQDYPNVVHYALTEHCDLFHVPSLNAPRDKNSNTIISSDYTQQPVQGYNIEVNEDDVYVNGMEFQLCDDTKHGDQIRRYEVLDFKR